jgi:predicted ArsR family transcriptional regulator
MSTIREQVLEYVHTQQSVTAGEVASLLGTTRANARHHLVILKRQGFIQVIGNRPAEGKGRPTLLYGLSQNTKGDNFATLSSALLSQSTLIDDEADQTRLFEDLVDRILQMVGDKTQPAGHKEFTSGSLTQRLYIAIQLLNRMNYHARWEAHLEAPHIRLGNCPYYAVIDNHPELCHLDSVLLRRLTGENVVQTEKLIETSRGLRYCAFVIDSS